MTVREAREYLGRICLIRWIDRTAAVHEIETCVDEVRYVPLLGAYIYAGAEEIRLDKVTEMVLIALDEDDALPAMAA